LLIRQSVTTRNTHITQDVRPSNCCVAVYVALWQKSLETLWVEHAKRHTTDETKLRRIY